MWYLQNVLINSAGAKAVYKKGSFYLVVEEKNKSSVFVNYATLFIFCSVKTTTCSVLKVISLPAYMKSRTPKTNNLYIKNFFDWHIVD